MKNQVMDVVIVGAGHAGRNSGLIYGMKDDAGFIAEHSQSLQISCIQKTAGH
jgi:thioredoxin reductase